jgi:hypothetical protein
MLQGFSKPDNIVVFLKLLLLGTSPVGSITLFDSEPTAEESLKEFWVEEHPATIQLSAITDKRRFGKYDIFRLKVKGQRLKLIFLF